MLVVFLTSLCTLQLLVVNYGMKWRFFVVLKISLFCGICMKESPCHSRGWALDTGFGASELSGKCDKIVRGEGRVERRRSNPVCISIAWYRTLTLFVEWRIIQSSLDRRYFNNLIAFILCVKIIATSDDWRSKSRECYLEGSKWKTGHQVGQCLVHVTKSIFVYRRFIGVVFVLLFPLFVPLLVRFCFLLPFQCFWCRTRKTAQSKIQTNGGTVSVCQQGDTEDTFS